MLKPDLGVVALSSRRAIEAHVHRRQPDLFDLLPIVWDRHAEFCACFGCASGRWLSDASRQEEDVAEDHRTYDEALVCCGDHEHGPVFDESL